MMILNKYYSIDPNVSIDLSIDVNSVFSENTYLAAGTKSKKIKGKLCKVNYLYKRSDVRRYQAKIEKVFYSKYKDYILDNIELLSGKMYLSMFEYNLNHSIDRRDLSNMKKLLEDSMTNVIKKVLSESGTSYKFDDSQIYETREVKLPTNESRELIRISLYPIIQDGD